MIKSRPEHDVLFCIARREPDRDLRKLLKQSLDWDYLLATASNHGLIPLLHKHLHSIDTDLIPINIRSRLKHQSVSNSQTVLHLFAKQLKLCRALTDRGIRAAILKGSLLAHLAYGEIALRQAGDIDVLIAPADFDRARQLLESLGYQMMPPLTRAQLGSHLKAHCEIQFVRDDWFTVVDLHWALAPKSFVFKLETEDLLTRLQRVSVAGVEFETLAIEDLILYQAMHGAKHLWRRLEWISSLGETIRAADSTDWDAVISRAADARATRMLSLGLQLAQRVSNIDVPVRLDKNGLADEVLSRIFTVSGAADSTETNLYNLKIMDRKRDALISALRALFVPTLTDWSSLNLPPSLHSLYYAYRPLRLSKIYSALLWQKLSSRGTE